MFIADYDRTVTDGSLKVDEECLSEIAALREKRVHTTLVTGRKRTFVEHLLSEHPGTFDSAVCENGCLALLNSAWQVASDFPQRSEIVRRFTEAGAPFDRGDCILSTEALSGAQVRELLAGIPGWHGIANVNSVMILPEGVDKGSGISKVQAENGGSSETTAAIGDGENDMVMRGCCSVLGAPASAVDDMKRIADFVSDHTYSKGTVDFVRYLAAKGLLPEGETRPERTQMDRLGGVRR